MKDYNITLNYNLIDVNKMSMDYLFKKNSLVSFGMILEKSKDKVELQKHQVIEPRELNLNTWIDKFIRNLLDKTIPADQRSFYDDFMKSLNKVHLKDFIDKIIDLLVDNKWIEVIDLQKNTPFLNYPQD